ncbi:MAG: hypothetical protein NUV80_06770 [Candidatus Berkelbacteria bacterium]|nr:hypothetical protein [Candidatus Berkelbacteria bacterium]
MSQLKGFKYLVRRSGEDGEIGPVEDAIQVWDDSPLCDLLRDQGYHEEAKEVWEELTGLVAGDMDGDGDHDREDREIIKEAKAE